MKKSAAQPGCKKLTEIERWTVHTRITDALQDLGYRTKSISPNGDAAPAVILFWWGNSIYQIEYGPMWEDRILVWGFKKADFRPLSVTKGIGQSVTYKSGQVLEALHPHLTEYFEKQLKEAVAMVDFLQYSTFREKERPLWLPGTEEVMEALFFHGIA